METGVCGLEDGFTLAATWADLLVGFDWEVLGILGGLGIGFVALE